MTVLVTAIILDFWIGDPRTWPHPVKWIGSLAGFMETLCRKNFRSPRFAGTVATIAIVGVTAIVASLFLKCTESNEPVHFVLSVLILYWSIAPKDLTVHSSSVFKALKSGNIEEARIAVSMIVGRDTAHLDEPEIVRAAVETVAESSVDGVLAPLFWFFIFGPVGAIVYRAINTLDSIYGHTDDRYIRFGTVAARLDDIATFIPARLSILSISIAAIFLRLNFTSVIPSALKFARLHRSPNSGWPESAFAGALDVQLGGTNFYHGVREDRAKMGEPRIPLSSNHIEQANRLMYGAMIVWVMVGMIFFR